MNPCEPIEPLIREYPMIYKPDDFDVSSRWKSVLISKRHFHIENMLTGVAHYIQDT